MVWMERKNYTLGHHLVAFLDVLGQRERFRQLGGFSFVMWRVRRTLPYRDGSSRLGITRKRNLGDSR